MSGTGRVHQKKLVTHCFDCNRFAHWSADPICPAKDKHDAQRRCTFTLSRLSRAQFQLNMSSEGQEHATLAAHALTKLTLKYWTLPCQERFKFGSGDPILCKTAYFIPVMIHGACAVM